MKLFSKEKITDELIQYIKDLLMKKMDNIKNDYFSIIIDSSTNIRGSRIVNIIVSIKDVDLYIKSIESNH